MLFPSAKMFVPRVIASTDICPPEGIVCVAMGIVGTDPSEKEANDKTRGPADFDKPGPHRYIGIVMVAVMLLLVLVLWLTLGKWPRRKFAGSPCGKRWKVGAAEAVDGKGGVPGKEYHKHGPQAKGARGVSEQRAGRGRGVFDATPMKEVAKVHVTKGKAKVNWEFSGSKIPHFQVSPVTSFLVEGEVSEPKRLIPAKEFWD